MATAKTPNPAPALSFPRPIFAAVSPHPFLQAHLTSGKKTAAQRANGRTEKEFRTPAVNTGSLTHCNGSAVVRLGNSSVVCGVRGEILKEEDTQNTAPTASATEEMAAHLDLEREEIETLRLVVPNVELSTGSTPQYIPGNAPSSFAQTLITRLRSLLLSTSLLRASDLRILYTPPWNPDDGDAEPEPQVKAYWVLYIDIFFICIDGNAFDSAWLSILAALRTTVLPRAFWDPDLEIILCDDAPENARRLGLRGLPVAASFAVFEGKREWNESGEEEEGRNWVLSDPDAFEESVCRESVGVVVDCSDGTESAVLRRVEKSGGGVVGREKMRELVQRAVERWGEVAGVLGEST
ncbi:exoribonuclease family protein [Byssothecium circinans]|uniref:Ribosomal RNA-processing protein 43 n=1 Tax=Byssothecium circinans TaxID=147558 RepID=A0A6A5UD06_9PLEO|nr:exoribonuclease family protein [Byssothecium circinans]